MKKILVILTIIMLSMTSYSFKFKKENPNKKVIVF